MFWPVKEWADDRYGEGCPAYDQDPRPVGLQPLVVEWEQAGAGHQPQALQQTHRTRPGVGYRLGSGKIRAPVQLTFVPLIVLMCAKVDQDCKNWITLDGNETKVAMVGQVRWLDPPVAGCVEVWGEGEGWAGQGEGEGEG